MTFGTVNYNIKYNIIVRLSLDIIFTLQKKYTTKQYSAMNLKVFESFNQNPDQKACLINVKHERPFVSIFR